MLQKHIYVHVPGACGCPKNIFDKITVVSSLETFKGKQDGSFLYLDFNINLIPAVI